MIPYDLDPSLHSGEPESQLLDDGFSPPQQAGTSAPAQTSHAQTPRDEVAVAPPDPGLWAKSAF
jgi:hypothetical protein